MNLCSEKRHPKTVARIRHQQQKAQRSSSGDWDTVHLVPADECEVCQ